MLEYSTPPLFVSPHEYDKVGAIQLGYTKSVRVEGIYDFLQFKYLAKEELEGMGKPSSMVRDEASEQQMLSMAPEGTRIEYYVYEYDQPGLTLALYLIGLKNDPAVLYWSQLHNRFCKEGFTVSTLTIAGQAKARRYSSIRVMTFNVMREIGSENYFIAVFTLTYFVVIWLHSAVPEISHPVTSMYFFLLDDLLGSSRPRGSGFFKVNTKFTTYTIPIHAQR